MGRFIQLVIGPAGVGKTSYCHTMQQHGKEGTSALPARLNPVTYLQLHRIGDEADNTCGEFGPRR